MTPWDRLPQSLGQRRGLRAAILRRLPRTWHQPPRVSELVVPDICAPPIAAYDIQLRANASGNVMETFAAPPISAPAMGWDVGVRIADAGGFSVRVFGLRYRTANKPANEAATEKEWTALQESDGKQAVLPLGTDSLDIPQPKAPADANNPYAALYGLLYPLPDEFAANLLPQYEELRPYQKAGIEFLVAHDSALLADDMGLGKTAQCSVAITVLLRSERIRRALIICPRTLVRQWVLEAHRWAYLYARPVEGDPYDRRRIWNGFPGAIIATPHIILNDIEIITKNYFDLVVCDDVTMLKNPGKITSAIRRIPRERSWCLSGTPLENKPEDLTNVMEFVRPGTFSAPERMRAPSRDTIQRRVLPFFLRRRKVDCLKELPEKQSFEPTMLEMEGQQAQAYRRAEAMQWDELQKLGIKVTKIHIFKLINILLQICNFHEQSGESAKAEEIGEQLDILFDGGDPNVKAVVFSRWVGTLEFLEKEWRRHKPIIYHGSLSPTARTAVLAQFKKDGRLLLMSTKAGSRGLNLQDASYVYHFDRSWNPMDEMQAEDRCWRMGQKRNVFVYRFLQVGTIEERIHQVLTRKHNQFLQYVDSMAEDTDPMAQSQWSIEELIDLMRPPR